MNVVSSTHPAADRRALVHAVSPLVFDVALPVGPHYQLSENSVADTPELIVSGLIPGLRSVVSLVRARKTDYLAVMMVALFALSLILLAFTGSPKFLLLKEPFGTVLVGLWCLAGAWTARPMTFYTARPVVIKGKPEALRAWDRLADTSPVVRSIQHRLALVWGVGLLAEAGIRAPHCRALSGPHGGRPGKCSHRRGPIGTVRAPRAA